MRGETANRVIDCVGAVLKAQNAIAVTAHLRGQLGMDSLDFCDLASQLEEAFGISVSNAEIDRWETVHDVIVTVEQKL